MKTKLTLLILLFFTTTNLLVAQKKAQPYKSGDFRLDIKLPHFNYLALNPNKKFKDAEFGFNGYGLGFEYNYKDKKFLEANTSFVMTFELPFPAPVHAEYNKILSSFYFNLTDNIVKNRFTFGYGINYSANTWKEWTRDFDNWNGNFDSIGTVTSSQTYINRNLGLTFNSYYRLGKTIHIGLIYQPSLLNLNNSPEFIYEHLISMEVNWRIKLFNTKNSK